MAKKGGDTPTEVGIEDLRSFLREEAERGPTGRPSKFEQVVALLPEIEALLARRRTKAEVRDLLASRGLEMSLGTFTQYHVKAKREAEGKGEIEPKPDRNVAAQSKPNATPNANRRDGEGSGLGAGKPVSHRLVNDA